MEGPKTKRMHVYVDKETCDKIVAESKNMGLTFSDYVIYITMTFDINCAQKRLEKTLALLDQYIEKNNVDYACKGDINMENNITKNKHFEKNSSDKKQFHLRVPQAVYDEIEKRASRQGMTVSNYIVFVTTQFDIVDISNKIDEVNNKLNLIINKEGC